MAAHSKFRFPKRKELWGEFLRIQVRSINVNVKESPVHGETHSKMLVP